MASYLDFPDLLARVYPCDVPDGLGEELPGLYNTLLSTVDWFEIEDGMRPTGACVLERPRHVLLFRHDGDTLEILNKEAAIPPADARRACRALLCAFPRCRRIHLEVMFPPTELRLPKRVLYWADHMVIDLPETPEEYTASLGKKTRQQLRRAERRLHREHPDIAIKTLPPASDLGDLVATFVTWKNRRFNASGRTTIWQNDPDSSSHFAELVRRRGQVRVTSIDGKRAAIQFVFPVGSSVYALQSAFDPDYLPVSLGMFSTYGLACEAAQRGYARVSLLWGTTDYKAHLGARPRRAVRLSIFRSQSARLYSLDEARDVAWRNVRRNGERDYWRVRHALGRTLRATATRLHNVSTERTQ